MLALNLPPNLDAELAAVAHRSGKPITYHVEAALAAYLEDQFDLALVEEAMRDYDPSKNVSLEDVKRNLGLDG